MDRLLLKVDKFRKELKMKIRDVLAVAGFDLSYQELRHIFIQ